ncbi:hypothetical protein ACJMK2_034648 [Sinanodonta woodiana]|uniref:G-protein coupled receptors family 1 profile domain-containing protein n=1 Tax=Sinanodonta woodiana TaxID=1069815 RepID=A0ABD3WWE2_SINWO
MNGTTFESATSTYTTDFTSLPTNSSESTIRTTTHLFDTYDFFTHPHWRQFPLPSDEWHMAIGVLITIVGFSGIIGNTIVIWIFGSDKSLQTPSNMLIINLAISDLTFSIVNGFPLFSISSFNKKWIFGQSACEFYGLIGGIFGLMSINTNAAIAIDRYYAIAKPLEVAKNMTRKRAFIMIVIVWILSFGAAFPPIFGWGRYIPEGFQTSCTYDYLTRTYNNISFIITLYTVGFALPLSVIVVFYSLIIKAINKHENEMKKTAKKLNAEMRSNHKNMRTEIKIAKIAMTILVLYVISWSPYASVALVAQFGDAKFVTPFWAEIPVFFAKASAMQNPIVYALSHPKFRNALYKKVPWLFCCCKDKKATPADQYSSRRSNQSVSSQSEMSYVTDTTRANSMKMRSCDDDRNDDKHGYRETSFRSDGRVTSEQLIHDLVQALVVVAGSQNKQQSVIQPVYLPTNITTPPNGATGGSNTKPADTENVFVVDNAIIPQVAEYLTKIVTNKTRDRSEGYVNPAMNMIEEKKTGDKSGLVNSSEENTTEMANRL